MKQKFFTFLTEKGYADKVSPEIAEEIYKYFAAETIEIVNNISLGISEITLNAQTHTQMVAAQTKAQKIALINAARGLFIP